MAAVRHEMESAGLSMARALAARAPAARLELRLRLSVPAARARIHHSCLVRSEATNRYVHDGLGQAAHGSGADRCIHRTEKRIVAAAARPDWRTTAKALFESGCSRTSPELGQQIFSGPRRFHRGRVDRIASGRECSGEALADRA